MLKRLRDLFDNDPIGNIVLGVMIAGVLALIWKVGVFPEYPDPARVHAATTKQADDPKFKAGDCYVHDGKLEPWHDWVEGMVWQVGYEHYRVVYAITLNYALQNGKDHFDLWDEHIGDFDARKHKVDCPKSWARFQRQVRK